MRWQRTLTVVGAHAEGEVGNVITGGIPDVPGATMFDKKEYLERETVHPVDPRIRHVANVLFAGPLERGDSSLRSRNAVMCGNGRLDRSPCGTGTAARLALLHARSSIRAHEPLAHDSAFGTRFWGEIVETTDVAGRPAVVSTIAGQAWITGIAQVGLDPTDPLPRGHTPSDVWFQS